MAIVFYNIFLALARAGLYLVSPFHQKAKKWVRGRRQIFPKLAAAIGPGQPIIWMHCASLGEFEQGRPLLEELRKRFPRYRVLLTFFSPSGYEVQKNYHGADWVFYLPLDSPRAASRFLDIVQPSLVIFVKYEFWYYYLKKIKYRQIPLLLVSALFREEMMFFKWYGGLHRRMLSRFDHLFVQNHRSRDLLSGIGLGEVCSVSGDTRFDRVVEIAKGFNGIAAIERFVGDARVIVAGSTWPADEEVLHKAWTQLNQDGLKLILAPHEVSEAGLAATRKKFPGSILYSELTGAESAGDPRPAAKVLIIDNYGMLSRLYYYGYVAFVGGGFEKLGVHNVLEAAVYGKPVLFGPYYEKYFEAIELVDTGGAIEVKDEVGLLAAINVLLQDANKYEACCERSYNYVSANQGATEKIAGYIQEKRLLTS